MRDGIQQRFCQQCGRFHTLDQFDGTRRSCRAMLQRHNARRNKRNPDALPLPAQDGPRSSLYAQQQAAQYAAQQQAQAAAAAAAAAQQQGTAAVQQLQQLLATAGGGGGEGGGGGDANGQLLAAVAGQLQGGNSGNLMAMMALNQGVV